MDQLLGTVMAMGPIRCLLFGLLLGSASCTQEVRVKAFGGSPLANAQVTAFVDSKAWLTVPSDRFGIAHIPYTISGRKIEWIWVTKDGFSDAVVKPPSMPAEILLVPDAYKPHEHM